MSIPKEPRMLMITLMYLVLMALLALNVSAEVMNAFFALDKGNKKSMAVINEQLNSTEEGLKTLLEDESKKKFQPLLPAVAEIRELSKEYKEYVSQLTSDLIDETGNQNGEEDEGDYIEDHGKKKPKGKKDKDGTTRLLLNQGRGAELKAKTIEIRDKMVKVYSDLLNEKGEDFDLSKDEIKNRIGNIEKNITLNIDDAEWEGSDKTSWEEFKFYKMPLAAVIPTLSQMQSDAKATEAALVNDLAGLSGGKVIEFDKFFPVVSAEKAYVIAGEPFIADISIGTYSSQINPADVTIKVNGRALPVNDEGIAKFTANSSSTGIKTLKLEASVRNPLTGEVSSGSKDFKYEVGRRSASVAADKMNVFYKGVKNPISVAAAGISSNDLNVKASSGLSLRKVSSRGNGKFDIEVTNPGISEGTITVSGGGLSPTKFDFRVKRIPDPIAQLSGNKGGAIASGLFKAQKGLAAILEGFDFEARCNIQSFRLVYVAKRQDAVIEANTGGTYSSGSRRLVAKARAGDVYIFDDIKARCPGDRAGRSLPNIVYNIR